jgi:hypothetical protein
MILVKPRHVRMAGGCAEGARVFLRRHGISDREFFLRGLPIDVVEATGDAMALRVAQAAREEAERG